jgi:hypothetical protein
MPGTVDFTLTNTGSAAPIDPALHLQDTAPHVASDIYRLSVSIDGAGWSAQLPSALSAAEFGQSASIPVHVTAGTAPTATITLTATSESDRTQTATATIAVGR